MRADGALLALVEGGARLVFTPQKPETLAELREKVKQHAADMGAHKCPMMQHDKAANAAASQPETAKFTADR
jgi:cysteine synthase